jgi:hypothetical protein
VSHGAGRPGLRSAWPLAALAALAAAWDVQRWVAAAPLWLDEEMVALNLRWRSFAELAGPLWLGQSAPLGWLAAERAALLTLGDGERALRLLPLLFGLATVAAVAWFGRRWLGWSAAALLLLACAAGPWLRHARFELKHYSADAFAGLLLPALAVWAVEAAEPAQRTRRVAAWWAVAVVAQWFANGALLATPACALLLVAASWRRGERRAALMALGMGAVWLSAFGLHYALALRYTHENAALRAYWAPYLPPPGAGLGETLSWLVGRLEGLGLRPGGSAHGVTLWLVAVCGFGASESAALGVVFAGTVLSAFVFAALGLVPLHDRLALWIVPALYVGVALLLDRSLRAGRAAFARRSWVAVALAGVAACGALVVFGDVLRQGTVALRLEQSRTNHGLDDRTAVRWLMAQRRPGDAVITTHLGWPAIWWYAGLAPPGGGEAWRGLPAETITMLEARYENAGPCPSGQLQAMLSGHPRTLVYLGFPDEPDVLSEALLRALAAEGALTAFREFGELSRAAIVDLGSPGLDVPYTTHRAGTARRRARVDGCMDVRPARPW